MQKKIEYPPPPWAIGLVFKQLPRTRQMLMNEKTCVFPILLQRIRYLKLFETAKIHVQIIRFTCCLNMALILSKPNLGHDLFGITLHVQRNAL